MPIQQILSSLNSVSVDTDAQAFFTAASISDTTQKSAINQLVLDLKAASIWTKMVALYPIVGGTQSTHSYNLKNPATFQITGATSGHSANGWLSSVGNTNLTPSISLTPNDTHISYYSRTDDNSGTIDIGCFSSATSAMYLYLRSGGTTAHSMSNESARLIVASPDSLGFVIATRRSSSDFESYKNGVSQGTQAGSAGTLPTGTIYIRALNFVGSATNNTNRQCAFASIGAGLTGVEATAFYTAVQAYQTTLSRNI